MMLQLLEPLCGYVRRTGHARPSHRQRLGRIRTIHDATSAVRVITAALCFQCSADRLLEIVVLIWSQQVPTDEELQALSLLQQQESGSHGYADFVLTTLWIGVNLAILERMHARRRMTRSVSYHHVGRPSASRRAIRRCRTA